MLMMMLMPLQRCRAIVIDSESDPDGLVLPEVLGGVANADCPSAHRRNRNHSSCLCCADDVCLQSGSLVVESGSY
jgi:hypothetical protein